MRRLPIVGVMGSGSQAYRELADPLGRWIAERGYHLLTGGGQGVMRAVAEAFVAVPDRAGMSIGIVPGWIDAAGAHHAKPGYPNPAVEIPILTHLPKSGDEGMDAMSRNHLNVLSASALVVLPGGAGTRSEALLALRYARPLVLFGPASAFESLPAFAARASTIDEVARLLRV